MYPGAHAIAHPDRPAFIMAGSGESVSYSEFEARANRLARVLTGRGLDRLDHYSIFMENNARYLEACAAGERSGLYYTCINSYLTADEVAYILQNSESRVLVTSAAKVGVALEAAAASGRPVCLMHMQGTPEDMQERPTYDRVVDDVVAFLESRVRACVEAGIDRASIAVDPGIGFGKRLEDNLALLNRLDRLLGLGLPLLVGVSRKSMIGAITGRDVDQRLVGSVVLAFFAAQEGAHILRVHDVAETEDARRILRALQATRDRDGAIS